MMREAVDYIDAIIDQQIDDHYDKYDSVDIRPKISELIPGDFVAIDRANFIRDNKVKYVKTPKYFGGAFCEVNITDDRFEKETLFVALRSLS